ncbi:MAG TPA: hypothetical protein VMS04_15980 [Vicinamibacterales bacterium]|nr:hypothetical protein [Vicinamibacterales bacterium]
MNRQYRFRLVVYQDVPGLWVGRGLDHDIRAEGRTIGETVRALLRMIQAHGAFDQSDERDPLSALPAAPPSCWNAFGSGAPITLAQLGAVAPPCCNVSIAIARHRPVDHHPRVPVHADA